MHAPDSASELRTCDIVMKGGITSGVVYPHAITNLAGRFRFINIGGTSAGAIAASLAAAAEHRRQSGDGLHGFAELAKLPALLGATDPATGRTRLFHFFQPASGARRLFAVATAALGGGWPAVRRVSVALLRHYPLALLLGLAPGLVLGRLAALALADGTLLWRCLAFTLGLLVAGVGAGLTAAAALLLDLVRKLPANRYGLCSGRTETETGEGLTDWLAKILDETAGLPPGPVPLLFAHLWDTSESDAETAARRVNLEMMTTCLSHGRPYRLPFRADADLRENHRFYFRPDEFAGLFPPYVVAWMLARPRAHDGKPSSVARRQRLASLGYHPLPAPADLPVVVATRMSLSFPVLLQAVPLHSIDRGLFPNPPAGAPKHETPERCWFSDGGMCSNFPLHFFDTALPRRPTFSFDLVEARNDTPGRLRPRMVGSNQEGIEERWHRFDSRPPARPGADATARSGRESLLGFFGAMVSTMQNWTDATQARLPGYRDRIVAVPLDAAEGGLNLDMPPARIQALTTRGAAAADLLLERFDVPAKASSMTWENHRWIRLRAYLAALEKSLDQLEGALGAPENGDLPYEVWLDQLIARAANAPSYAMDATQLQAAAITLAQLRAIRAHWVDSGATAAFGAPRPRPALRPRAQI